MNSFNMCQPPALPQTTTADWLNGGEMMMLLHYHCGKGEYLGPGSKQFHEDCLRGLRKLELVHEGSLDLTERGHHLVGFWKACPLPQMRWSDPRSNRALEPIGEGSVGRDLP